MDYEKELGKVASTFIGIEDHGILAFNIDFDFGSHGQGTGHYNIQGPQGSTFLKNVLETLGVSTLDGLKGRNLYVLREGKYGLIKGLETLPFDARGSQRIIFKDAYDESA